MTAQVAAKVLEVGYLTIIRYVTWSVPFNLVYCTLDAPFKIINEAE